MGGGVSRMKKLPPQADDAAAAAAGDGANIPKSTRSPSVRGSPDSPGSSLSPPGSPRETQGTTTPGTVPAAAATTATAASTSASASASKPSAATFSAETLIGWTPTERVIHLDVDKPGEPVYHDPDGVRETREARRHRLRAAVADMDWSSATAIDEVFDMFGSALQEARSMRSMSHAVASTYLSELPREGLTEEELLVRDAGLAGKPEAAKYFLEGVAPVEALEREYAKLAPPDATHAMLPSPASPIGRIIVLEVPGGADKREDGHRPDTVPILNACVANGFAAEPRFYMDATAPAIAWACERADAVVVRVPSDEDVPGVTHDALRAMLSRVRETHGTVILPGVAAADVMNRADAVARLAAAGRADPKRALACVALDAVERPCATAASTRGEVRVEYAFDTPIEVTVRTAARGGLGGAVCSGATHDRVGVEDPRFEPLLEGFGRRDMHRLMPALGLPPGTPLPLFWSVDFVSADADERASDDGRYGYVMTGLSCAVSGKVIPGSEAVDAESLASIVGRALRASVPQPYARAKARAAAEAESARMLARMEEQRRAFDEERRRMQEEMEEERRKMQEELRKLTSAGV